MAVATVPRGKSIDRTLDETPAASTFEQIRVDQVDVGENIRIQPGELDDMAASILEHGVLSPIKVVGPHKDGRYKLVYGQRRLLASRQAQLLLIPAIVVPSGAEVDHPGAKRSIEQLVENLQRADLNPIDEAKALRQVLDADPELTQDELAKRLGRSAPWVSNTLRLLELAPVVQAFVANGQLSHSHAKAIAGLTEHASQESVAEQAVRYDRSAKQVEYDVKARKQMSTTEPERKEQIRKKTERFAKKLIKLAEEHSVPKGAAITASTYDVDPKQLATLLKAAGFAGADYGYGFRGDELTGACDCSAYRYETYPSARFERVCVNQKHVDALQAQREAQRRQHDKDIRDKRARFAGVVEKGLASIDATAARMALVAIGGWNLNQLLGVKGNQSTDAWPTLEAMPADEVVKRLASAIADNLVDERDRFSAGITKVVNKLAAAPAKKATA